MLWESSLPTNNVLSKLKSDKQLRRLSPNYRSSTIEKKFHHLKNNWEEFSFRNFVLKV